LSTAIAGQQQEPNSGQAASRRELFAVHGGRLASLSTAMAGLAGHTVCSRNLIRVWRTCIRLEIRSATMPPTAMTKLQDSGSLDSLF